MGSCTLCFFLFQRREKAVEQQRKAPAEGCNAKRLFCKDRFFDVPKNFCSQSQGTALQNGSKQANRSLK